jgi:hypothetical protein
MLVLPFCCWSSLNADRGWYIFVFYCGRFAFCLLALHIYYPKSLLTVNGNVMATQTAVMALMKPIVMNHVQTTSLLAKISSVSACLGAVMGMMIVVITLMRISVKLLLVHQVDTGQCACAVCMHIY